MYIIYIHISSSEILLVIKSVPIFWKNAISGQKIAEYQLSTSQELGNVVIDCKYSELM
jgi:hypothetical protein